MRSAAIAAVLAMVAGSAAAQVTALEALTGQWVSIDSTGAATVFRLEPSGSCSIDDMGGRCELAGNRITLRNAAGAVSYMYSVSADKLTFSGGDLDRPLVFQRGGVPAPAAAAAPLPPPPRQAAVPPPLPGLHPIVGRWSGQGGELVVARDGTLSLNGEAPSRWQAQGNVLYLSRSDGTAVVPFQLQGNVLYATVEGQQLVFQRLPGALPETAFAARPPAPGGGFAAVGGQELVGTWCYMANVNAIGGGRMSGRCFTLNGNGTYTYRAESSTSTQYGGTSSSSADTGTWQVSGGVIYVNSRNSGALQYGLTKRNHPRTGDPMLCLDGDCYVTATQRRPW